MRIISYLCLGTEKFEQHCNNSWVLTEVIYFLKLIKSSRKSSTKTRSAHKSTLGAITTLVNLFSQHYIHKFPLSHISIFQVYFVSEFQSTKSCVCFRSFWKPGITGKLLKKKNFHYYFESAKKFKNYFIMCYCWWIGCKSSVRFKWF